MNKQLPGAIFMRKIAKIVHDQMPKGFGFAIMVFPFHSPGIANYISSAERETMIKALKETVTRLEQKADFQTPEEN